MSDFKLVSGSGGGVPVGSIVAYSGTETTPPSGFLWCDGAKYNKLTFPELYDVIGETYTPDAEKGGLDFRVPDLTDKIPWQSGSLSGSKAVGEEIPAGVPNITGKITNYLYTNISLFVDGARTGAFYGTDIGAYHADTGRGGYGSYARTIGFNANNGASTSGIYRDDAKTVQPPALSMRYMIRYTADEEKAKEVFDFSEEVKRQLAQSIMEEEIKKQICEKTYPIGSIYQNATDHRNPNIIFGCGTWEPVTANRYLMAAGTDLTVASDYDAYNNRYGNYAGIELNECISNITGSLNYYNGYGSGGGGAISVGCVNSNWLPSSKEEHTSRYNASFNAANGSTTSVFTKQKIFRGSCGAVRPQTYPVYIWQRVG